MARPVKWRKIENIPQILRFYPEQSGQAWGGENILRLEEIEAIRLKDLEGLEQEDCANRMEVSRPTFQRILVSARKKIADSLIQGKEIRIDGGFLPATIASSAVSNAAESGLNALKRSKAAPASTSFARSAAAPNCNAARTMRVRKGSPAGPAAAVVTCSALAAI